LNDPVAIFNEWLDEARAAGVEAPEAMTLATADGDGRPSARMLLLKGADADGFTFFSGYESRKGRELAENPKAALLFHWDALGRQVRIEGDVERLDAEESDAYFESRPRGSRLGAAASRQSEPIESREALERRYAELEAAHPEAVPRPESWGGFRLRPRAFEFWQHGYDRLHDRFRYTPDGYGWRIDRLSP
jgi:pyridoxamine 5'-phosphate oxidase